AFDDELMKGRGWSLRTVRFTRERERSYWLYLSLKQRLFGLVAGRLHRFGVAERAAEKAFGPLAALAEGVTADLYIAHHAEALGAAARAARKHGALLGFDAEDFHTGMNETGTVSAADRLVAFLEAKYLPRCDYMTAASKGIADAYREKYGLRPPGVILNVFPLEQLPVRTPRDPVKFYWYSQVIGPHRGIELLLDAASRIELPFEIHLRGLCSPEYKEKLDQLCRKSGLSDRVFLHEPILAARLIADANQFDVGLALESNVSINRNICVTNKVFSYLMSRLFIIGTDTAGQKDIFTHFPGAVRICRMEDPEDLADAMRSCITGRISVIEGKKAADDAVNRCFNWDRESAKLQDMIHNVLHQKLYLP